MACSLATSVVFTWRGNISATCRAVQMRSTDVVESQNFHVSWCPPVTSHASDEHELEAFQWRLLPQTRCLRPPASTRSLSWFLVQPTVLRHVDLLRHLCSCRPTEFRWLSTQTLRHLTGTSWWTCNLCMNINPSLIAKSTIFESSCNPVAPSWKSCSDP